VRHKVVLVNCDVINDGLHRSYLVAAKSVVYRRSVKVFVTSATSFLFMLVFVEYRVVVVEMNGM
tara:strand:+ start:195 stop:386 length:192 start_codon:yes stop_codon:yes gene_type:complete